MSFQLRQYSDAIRIKAIKWELERRLAQVKLADFAQVRNVMCTESGECGVSAWFVLGNPDRANTPRFHGMWQFMEYTITSEFSMDLTLDEVCNSLLAQLRLAM